MILDGLPENLIKISVHDGITYLSKEYNHHGRSMVVKVKQYENDSNFVYSGLYRDDVRDINGYFLEKKEMSLSVDFFEEMDFLFNFMIDKNIEDKMSYLYAFDAIIENHIENFGRLIDTDMEGYLDNSLRLILHFYKSINPYLVPNKTEGIKIRNDFRRLIKQKYFDYIWVNVNDPFDPTSKRLVKLSNL